MNHRRGSVTSIAPIDRTERGVIEESGLQTIAVRAVAATAVIVTLVYLVWRTTATIGDWWVGIPLLVLETHMAFGLMLFVFSLWDVSPPQQPGVTGSAGHSMIHPRIAVFIPTYDEPEEVLLPTIAGAVALAEAQAVYVLDDGDRDWVRDVADHLGALYLTRDDHDHAKAGNINAALRRLRGQYDMIAVLDADHVPGSRFLTNTIRYFEDPSVALVQMPQEFYNAGSFEHGTNRSLLWPTRRSIAYSEQGLFYRVLQPGEEPLERRFLVRHQRRSPRYRARRRRWCSDRVDNRGHPHDPADASSRLADHLSQ